MTIAIRVNNQEIALAEDYSIFMDENHEGRLTINFTGYKTPINFDGKEIKFSSADDKAIVIAALIHMLGGAVTISDMEYFAAMDYEILAYRNEFKSMTLKVK